MQSFVKLSARLPSPSTLRNYPLEISQHSFRRNGGSSLDGVANYTTTKLSVGTGPITAEYEGSSSFQRSTSAAVSQVVNQASAPTTLVSSLNPSDSGQSVAFPATVVGQFSGRVTGSVTFLDGTSTLKTVSLDGGIAEYKTSALPGGTEQHHRNLQRQHGFYRQFGLAGTDGELRSRIGDPKAADHDRTAMRQNLQQTEIKDEPPGVWPISLASCYLVFTKSSVLAGCLPRRLTLGGPTRI
jgi:Bacterial Ig-like domain (group 3)